MRETIQPISLLLALWPTPEFEFPADPAAMGERLRAQFGQLIHQRQVQAQGGALPPEIPRLILSSERNRHALELAPGRINLRCHAAPPVPVDDMYAELSGLFLPLHAWLAENFNVRIYRVGLMSEFFCPTRASANAKIGDYFFRERALQGQPPHEINVNMLHRLTLEGGWVANRWLRVQPLRSSDPRHVDFAARIEIDINTLADDTQVKPSRQLQEFILAVQRHVTREIPLFQDPDFMD
jgi:hypothetical protein